MNFSILVLITVISVSYASVDILYPIILIPGTMSSQIEVKHNQNVDQDCYKGHSNYFTQWLNSSDLLYFRSKCLNYNLGLHYNKTTRTTHNTEGVETRIPGFGSLSTISNIDVGKKFQSYFCYFAHFILKLTRIGYVKDVSLRGAPYDFRKGPTEQEDFFVDMKKLIENTYEINGQKRVILIPHSMGGIMSVAFLRRQSQVWKDKYIHSMISLSAVYGGSVKAIHSLMNVLPPETNTENADVLLDDDDDDDDDDFHNYIAADDENCSVLKKIEPLDPYSRFLKLRYLVNFVNKMIDVRLIRSLPGVIWLFPSPKAWNRTEDVLVKIGKKEYTLANINEYFRDTKNEIGWEMYQDAYPTMLDLGHPGVKVHCLYGTETKTVEQIHYKPGSNRYVVSKGNGDGTVNLRSLEVCKNWINESNDHPVIAVPFPKLDHMDMVKHDKVIQHVISLVSQP